MLMLLSPAKDLAKEAPAVKDATLPVLLGHAGPLVDKLRALSARKLADLMGMSLKLGELNQGRFARWGMPFSPQNARPAIFAYHGEAYRALSARTLTSDDLRFAQHHLRIISGLYGVLRPLDLIQDYRLMMGTPLRAGKAKDLYAYWQGRITEVLAKDLRASGDRTIINLASVEYSSAVDMDRLGARVVTPVFKDQVGGTYKAVHVFLKHQRGAMARHIIRHRLLEPERIKAYDGDGYRFTPEESTSSQWVFLRGMRPPPNGGRPVGARAR